MAKCFNRNTPEYQALQEKFETTTVTNSLINAWQVVNNSDAIPTIYQAEKFTSRQKAYKSLGTNALKEAVLNNLRRKKLISKLYGRYYINNSAPQAFESDPAVLKANTDKVMQMLDWWGVNLDSVIITPTPKSVRIDINENQINVNDAVLQSKDSTHLPDIISHLTRLFPDVNIMTMEVKDAEAYYNSLPQFKYLQERVKDFNKVRSFYDGNGNAVLIKGRVNSEIAIEEVLHPFINSLAMDKASLFSNLTREARQSFPKLRQEIDDAYNNDLGFTQEDRNRELVTQSLSRYFKREYETQPTQNWKSQVKLLLKWLMDIINDLSRYVVGSDLKLRPGMIDNRTTMSDIAKLLNTGDLEFVLGDDIGRDRKVFHKLTDRLQKVLDYQVEQAETEYQAEVALKMFNVKTDKTEFDDFTVGLSGNPNYPLLMLNRADHKYINPDTLMEYNGLTSKIGGHMAKSYKIKDGQTIQDILKENDIDNIDDVIELNPAGLDIQNLEDAEGNKLTEIFIPETDYQTNIDIGNDFDSLVEAYLLDEPIDTVDLKVVDKKVAIDFTKQMSNRLEGIRRGGGILIPQVVISDGASRTGSAVDLLLIQPDGSINIIDLKTSKNELFEISEDGELKYDIKYPVKYGSIFYNESLPHSKQIKLSKRQQHNLQVNSYSQILKNQGHNVNKATTLHVHTPTIGEKKDQKYTQKFTIEREINHMESADVQLPDGTFAGEKLVTVGVDPVAEKKMEDIARKTGQTLEDISESEKIAEEQAQTHATEQALTGLLTDFSTALVTRKEAVRKIRNQSVLLKDKQEILNEIDNVTTQINVAVIEGRVGPLYTQLLKQSIDMMDEFIVFANDPKNWGKEEFIGKVLNFQSMVNTYVGLTKIKNVKGLKAEQKDEVLKLIERLNTINGVSDGLNNIKEGDEGLINQSIDNYVKSYISENSNKDFTKEELEDLLRMGKDIGMFEYQTGDMATSSDTILALMDKIFKQKRQEVLDRIQDREEVIREKAMKLQKFYPTNKVNYDFMLVMGPDGIPTGHYVTKMGQQYVKMEENLLDKLKDEVGDPLEYVVKDNIDDYTNKELEYNRKLYQDRQSFKNFRQAETQYNGELLDGDYHRYTKEFKEERKKYMVWVVNPSTDTGRWKKRSRVSTEEYIRFRTKFYESKPYMKMKKDNNKQPIGIVEDEVGKFIKSEYIEPREISANGEEMRSEKYLKLQSPQTELERAQKEFYDMYVDNFENDLLKKLPMHVTQQMYGRMPLIKDDLYRNLKKKGNLFTRLWAKSKDGATNLFTTTQSSKVVLTDENGRFKSTLPMYYVGKPMDEKVLKQIDNKINSLTEQYKAKEITETQYKNEIGDLKDKRQRLQARPKTEELSLDMADNLMRFSQMAENYEVMSGIEDTLSSMLKVLEKREYIPSGSSKMKTYIKGKLKNVGVRGKDSGASEANIVRRARKWMEMVYYDNDEKTQNFFDKVAKGLINYTSLTYVGFNPWGNINNYAIGRLNNMIETAGGLYFESSAMRRATREFNTRMIPDFMKRLGGKTALNDMLGISPSDYQKYKPGSKYEALVDLFRMMDDKADIREQGQLSGKETTFRRVSGWGYILNDSFEYNVQSKVGMAILMSTKVKNSKTGDILSLFDSYQYNQQTGELDMKEGYDTIIDFRTKKEKKMSDNVRYDIRNNIREVNKQIHGNYAYEDRMVMQSSSLGQLAAQFHKWIAPAIKARYRSEYFDENLGWVEGRYRTFWSFLTHTLKHVGRAKEAAKEWEAGQHPDKMNMKMRNVYRTTGELSLIVLTLMMKMIFQGLHDPEDEDKSATRKRAENAIMYQLDRQRREMSQFLPVIGFADMYMMMKSPISSTRMLGEMAEALMTMVQTPMVLSGAAISGELGDIKLDKRIYYQRGSRKGQLRMKKEWMDVFPILYALNRWLSYDKVKNFHVK
jgi:hypothetical protein